MKSNKSKTNKTKHTRTAERVVRLPRGVQTTIPIKRIYSDAIWQVGQNEYAKSWYVSDINYAVADEQDKLSILEGYGRVLNGLSADSRLKVTIVNRDFDPHALGGQILMRRQNDTLDDYRAEFNRILMDKAKGSNGIIQEKLFTLSVTSAKSIEDARSFFERTSKGISINLQRLSANLSPLSNHDRFRLLHDFFRPHHKMSKSDLTQLMQSGTNFKDIFCPLALRYRKDYIEMPDTFARVLFMEEFATRLSDQTILKLLELPRQMMVSIDIKPVNTQQALKHINKVSMSVESDINRWQQRQNNNNNFSAEVPYEFQETREVVRDYMDAITKNDQHMLRVTVTVVHMADTLAQLDADTKTLQATASENGCTLTPLVWQQDTGLDTALPYGLCRIQNERTLLTDSTSILTPFSAQEIQQPGGICYGNNAVSGNLILANRCTLLNGNGIRLGVSGAGKSMSAKQEIASLVLSTQDDILILDPEGEFGILVQEFGGNAIDISGSSSVRINALDMEKGYADAQKNPLPDKSEFVTSLFEQMMKKDINAKHRSLIDRCLQNIYMPYIEGGYQGNPPTLDDLYHNIQMQPEDEARDLALSAELFITGTLNIFAGQTNIDQNNRLTSYNILDLGEQLMPLGMLVILESIYNRVIQNWQRGRRTWIFVDEFSIFFRYPFATTYFLRMWKQVRKRGGMMTGITQNVGEMLSSSDARYILANSEFLIMLSQSASDRAVLAELLGISNEQLSYVDNAPPGCGLMKFGGSFIPFVNDLPQHTKLYRLMTTKPGEQQKEE